MTQHTDLIDELRTCAGDPMSLDWAYIEKATITRAADALEATAKNAFEAMPHDIPQRMKDAICEETGWSGSLVSRAYIELRKAFTGEPYKANEDLDAALLEIERLRKDAERYQFLRYCDLDEMAQEYWPGGDVPTGEALDSAIDAAMKKKAQP